jgi:glycosyltransferase involved in cell wall biosynthesis
LDQTLSGLARLGFECKIPSFPPRDSALHRKKYELELSDPSRTTLKIGDPGTKELVVLVNSFNLFPLLEDTFRSIRNQTLNSFDVFVMDGGSTDGSLEWIRDREDLSLISSSDRNFVDGLNMGLSASNHKYVTQCAVSDGYCDPEWFAKATSLMDSDASIDLVFGFPVVLNEDESFGNIGWPDLFYADLSDSNSIRNHWITKGFVLPEGNFVARREVFNECFPQYRKQIYRKCEPFLEFTSNFFSSSRRAVGIPTVANFGRTHPNQLGEAMRESRLHHVHDFRFLRQRWFFFVKQYLLPVHRYSKSHLRLAWTIITQFDWKSASVICRRRIFSLIRNPF